MSLAGGMKMSKCSGAQPTTTLLSKKSLQRPLLSLMLALALATTGLLFGCTTGGSTEDPAGRTNGNPGASEGLGRQIIIGSMVTEDILPMWVAEEESIFSEYGIDATVVTFQSAQELSTAVVSGSVDIAMTDIMVSATLSAAGTPVVMEWVALGVTPEQGRFGILANPARGITSPEQLAGVPVGVGSNTLVEYVMYKLLKKAGLSDDQIVTEEIKKVPVRYEMMTSDQIAAAALPGALLALGEATGMVLVADDSTGDNLSQTVMIVREDFADTTEGLAMIETLASVWDDSVARINATPESYRSLLVQKAQLPEPVKENYKIAEYPQVQKPTSEMVDPVLDWMLMKGYLSKKLSYDYSSGSFITPAS
jgi:NitT/TauT family transport system substrate-binding protein